MRKGFMIGAALSAALLASPAAAQRIDAEIEALTLRVEKLEGIRAVKKLQRAFGYYVDRGLWSEAAHLFADDGTIEIGIDGVYAGRERIEEYLRRLHGGQEGLIYGQLNEWVTLQPAIDVAADGRSATARWREVTNARSSEAASRLTRMPASSTSQGAARSSSGRSVLGW